MAAHVAMSFTISEIYIHSISHHYKLSHSIGRIFAFDRGGNKFGSFGGEQGLHQSG